MPTRLTHHLYRLCYFALHRWQRRMPPPYNPQMCIDYYTLTAVRDFQSFNARVLSIKATGDCCLRERKPDATAMLSAGAEEEQHYIERYFSLPPAALQKMYYQILSYRPWRFRTDETTAHKNGGSWLSLHVADSDEDAYTIEHTSRAPLMRFQDSRYEAMVATLYSCAYAHIEPKAPVCTWEIGDNLRNWLKRNARYCVVTASGALLYAGKPHRLPHNMQGQLRLTTQIQHGTPQTYIFLEVLTVPRKQGRYQHESERLHLAYDTTAEALSAASVIELDINKVPIPGDDPYLDFALTVRLT